MTGTLKMSLALVAMLAIVGTGWAQESPGDVSKETAKVAENAQETADEVVDAIDKNEQAREVSAGILKPIYQLAESFSFPAFHWIAFALMMTGLVSFALQLTLGKLVVLSKLSFSLSEILSDVLGLLVSLLGLVLTTQAATENSTFTTSATAVLSSAAVGLFLGLIFYVWGQRQELQAVEGRRRMAEKAAAEKQA